MVISIFFKEVALEAARADAEKKFMDNHEQEEDLKNIEKHYSEQLAAMQEQLTVSFYHSALLRICLCVSCFCMSVSKKVESFSKAL